MDIYEYINEQKLVEKKRRSNAKILGKKLDIPFSHNKTMACIIYGMPKQGDTLPTLFHIHGGGFVTGEAEMDHVICEMLSADLGIQVVSLQYQLAPDNPYPGQSSDCYHLIEYLVEHAEAYGINVQKLGIIGMSSGANIATVVCMMAAERGRCEMKCQLLLYPYLDLDTDPAKKPGSMEGPAAEFTSLFYGFNDLYAKNVNRKMKYVSPSFASTEELKGMPATLILTGDADFLQQEGHEYAQKLQDAGVSVVTEDYDGAGHGFIDVGLNEDYARMNFPVELPEEIFPYYFQSQNDLANQAVKRIENELTEYLLGDSV